MAWYPSAARWMSASQITIRQHKSLHNLIEAIPEDAWTPIPYWMDGAADVAETTCTPFQAEADAAPVRLIVRRVKPTPGSQLALFAKYSYHGFITDRDGELLELGADHRLHAEIENAIRDLKYGVGLNHLPSGRFAANGAWLAVVFGGASWQRCRTHFMTNLLTRVPRRAQPWVATMVRTIYQQPSPDEVHAQLDRVTDQLQNRFPQVASLLDEAGPDVLAFSNFPLAHWKKIWSNNPQERLNKEIRRRTDVVGIFPNRPAVRRLVGAVLAEQHDEWAIGRRYITPVVLTFNEALPEAGLAEATAA